MKISLEKNDLISLGIMIIIGFIFIMLGIIIVGNQPEVFNDIIIESTANKGSNMSKELSLFWSVLFLGIPFLLVIDYFFIKKKKVKSMNDIPLYLGLQTILAVANFIFFLVNGNVLMFLLYLSFMSFINHVIDPKKQIESIVLPIIVFYFLLTLCTIFNYLGIEVIFNFIGKTNIFNTSILIIFSIMLDIIILIFSKKKNCLNKILMVLQIILPCLFLLYKCERYIYNNQIYYYVQPLFARVFFDFIIILMIVYGIYKFKKNWENIEKLPISNILLITTCISIFAVNSVPCQVKTAIPDDLHHSVESVISYQQIFGKGQKAYIEYSPVSGLFPVFTGFILELLGGNFSNYELAHTIFLISFSILIMYLLTKHLKTEDCLLISLFFVFPDYDRVAMILPILLILLLPKLIKNRNLWLKLWMLLCCIGGIYYPTYGVAVLMGTMPFGLVQIYQFIKTGELKEKLKSFKFYLGWIICLLPVLYFAPMLIRMAKHILRYSSQTILADGIAVFGQEVPSFFMPYLNSVTFLRTFTYYSIRYLLPIITIWILIILLVKCLKSQSFKELIKTPKFLMISSAIITLLVSYTSTIIRNDTNTLMARTKTVLVLIGGIYLYIFIQKYMKKNIGTFGLIGLIVGISIITNCSGIRNLDNRYLYAYKINDNYEIINNELENKYPRLGEGFIKKDYIKTFDNASRAYELLKYDSNLSFYAFDNLSIYYILDLKTVGQPSIPAIKGYQTSQEVIEAIKKYKPVVGLAFTNSYSDYYLYKWILTSDDYVYDDNYKVFLPKELFEKIYGNNINPNDKKDIPLYATKIGRASNSLGRSLQSLKKVLLVKDNNMEILKKGNNQYQINFEKEIEGLTNDFLYIKFDTKELNEKILNNKTFLQKLFKHNFNDNVNVTISFDNIEENKNTISSILGTGELLIPIGSNVNWLLNNHDNIEITISNLSENIEISDISFYELNNYKFED